MTLLWCVNLLAPEKLFCRWGKKAITRCILLCKDVIISAPGDPWGSLQILKCFFPLQWQPGSLVISPCYESLSGAEGCQAIILMWGNNFHLSELQRGEGRIRCCCAVPTEQRDHCSCLERLCLNIHCGARWTAQWSHKPSDKFTHSGWKRDTHIGWSREILCWHPLFPKCQN